MATTLADIRNRVLRKLDRRNVPVSTVNQWIGDAVRRIQQTIRVPIDEALTQVLTEDGFNGLIDIPTEMTELLSLRVNGIELEQRSITEINAQRALPLAQPRYYTRVVGQYRIAPIPQAGSVIELEYRSAIEPGSADTTTIRLFDLKPELVECGALRIAADDSDDDVKLARWTAEYNSHFLELQALALRDDFQNASMAPAYNLNGDWY